MKNLMYQPDWARPGFALTCGHAISGAEQVATWAKEARVYKSFRDKPLPLVYCAAEFA